MDVGWIEGRWGDFGYFGKEMIIFNDFYKDYRWNHTLYYCLIINCNAGNIYQSLFQGMSSKIGSETQSKCRPLKASWRKEVWKNWTIVISIPKRR